MKIWNPVPNQKIWVIDNVISHSDAIILYSELKTCFFRKNNRDINLESGPIYKSEKWLSYLSGRDIFKPFAEKPIYKEALNTALKNVVVNFNDIFPEKFAVERSYINYSDAYNVDKFHVDDFPGNFTFLLYGLYKWDIDWRGETIFKSPNEEEIMCSITPKPTRAILFDANIFHSATPPSFDCPYNRYTLVAKILNQELVNDRELNIINKHQLPENLI